jgi:hypothetical protein
MLSWSLLNLVFTYWTDLAPRFVPGKRALKHLEGLDSGVQAVSWCALDKWVGEVKRGKQDISAGARLKFHGHHQPNGSCSSAHLLYKEEHTFMFWWCTTKKNPIFMWRCKEQNSKLASPWSNNNLRVAYISKRHITSSSSFTSSKKGAKLTIHEVWWGAQHLVRTERILFVCLFCGEDEV